MARGSRTPIPAAAQAKALAEIGYTGGQIARATGLSRSTVADILNGNGAWGNIIQTDHCFNLYRTETKRQLQLSCMELSKKALLQVEDKLPNASAAQAAVIYGVLRDKERLDAGESTANIAIHDPVEIANLQDLCQSLSKRLMPEQEQQS